MKTCCSWPESPRTRGSSLARCNLDLHFFQGPLLFEEEEAQVEDVVQIDPLEGRFGLPGEGEEIGDDAARADGLFDDDLQAFPAGFFHGLFFQ